MDERKVAVITGGSSGTGFAIAQTMIDAGYRVRLIARDETRLREAATKLGPLATFQRADVGRLEHVQAALAGLDHIDVLVQAAGFLRPVSLATPLHEAAEN